MGVFSSQTEIDSYLTYAINRKQGKKEEADKKKSETAALKEESKQFEKELASTEEEIKNILVQMNHCCMQILLLSSLIPLSRGVFHEYDIMEKTSKYLIFSYSSHHITSHHNKAFFYLVIGYLHRYSWNRL